MRIAMITDGAAAGRDSADLAAMLTRFGHEVVMHTAAPGQRAKDMVRSFTDQWRATPPAIVHCRSRIASDAAVTAARAASLPVVHSTRHDDDAPTGTFDRDIALRADRVIASCTAELSELTAGKVPRQRISVVPYGIDADHFTPDGGHPPIGHRYRLVAVGDLTPSAGFATAVAALVGLPDTELIIAGEPKHGSHAKELREYARRLGVADRLRMPGPVARSTLPSLLRSAHIVLCTPWRPRFGIAALEAAACGVAVVANNTGGLTDTVVDGVTGLLVAPHQPRTLAAAVWQLLAQPIRREQYGATGRDRASSRYCWHQIAVETLHAYSLVGITDAVAAKAVSSRR
ncbi:glycosyltransferase [Actinophytocola sp.]|uniref:glycosyltransferase n=1 Tax=Actinophytocola sp. TaxID=1872138 RepID=UPI002D44CD62|nr:glycosyltransferase [Actinophytocola sp.]HYQ65325.1 glycosyltransferase [Actinophytocola sp.]